MVQRLRKLLGEHAWFDELPIEETDRPTMLGGFLFAQREQRQNGIKHGVVSTVDGSAHAVLFKEDPRGMQGIVGLLKSSAHQRLDVVTHHAAMPSCTIFITR